MILSQSEASDMFDIPTRVLYVCDGKKPCAKPSCLDHSDQFCCHHTSDPAHALYAEHDGSLFKSHSAIREDGAAILLVEQIRG